MTKHSASVSLKALLVFCTSPTPSFKISECVKILQPALDLKSDAEIKKWFHAHTDREKAATSLLIHLLNPPLNRNQRVDSQSKLLGLSLQAVPFLQSNQSKALLKEIVLNVAHPDYLRILMPQVVSLLGSKPIEKWVVEAMTSDNQLHIANALHLIYFVFNASPEITLTDSTLKIIAKRLKELKSQEDLNPLLRSAIDDIET